MYEKQDTIFDQLYEQHFFLTSSKEVFFETLEQEIKTNIRIYQGSNGQYKKRLDRSIPRIYQKQRKQQERTIEAMKICVENFDTFEEFIQFYNQGKYPVNVTICAEIIESSEWLRTTLETIIDQNQEKIECGDFEAISYSEVYITFLIAYCELYEIEYKSPKEEKNRTSLEAYLFDMNHLSLTEEDDELLLKKAQNGNQKARNEFVEKHLKLPLFLAREYQYGFTTLEDRIQEANIGLINASEYYDSKKETTFSYYASFCIKRSIKRYLRKNEYLGQLSETQYLMYLKYRRLKEKWEDREPVSLEVIAKELNLSLDEIKLFQYFEQNSVYLEETDVDDTQIDNCIKQMDFESNLYPLFERAHLSQIQIQTLEQYFGLKNGQPIPSQSKIARIWGVKPQAIQERLERSMSLLRNTRHIKDWADYMEDPKEALHNLEKFQKKYVKKIDRGESIWK